MIFFNIQDFSGCGYDVITYCEWGFNGLTNNVSLPTPLICATCTELAIPHVCIPARACSALCRSPSNVQQIYMCHVCGSHSCGDVCLHYSDIASGMEQSLREEQERRAKTQVQLLEQRVSGELSMLMK